MESQKPSALTKITLFNHYAFYQVRYLRYITLLTLLLQASVLFAQLSSEALRKAIEEKNCSAIASDLEITSLVSEEMKFNGAVCYYRNGKIERALELFEEVWRLGAEKRQLAAFWTAKCHASLGRDSLSWEVLKGIPDNFLNFRMLTQPEFDALAKTIPPFLKLRQSLAPGFNGWTLLLGGVALVGFFLGAALFLGKTRFTAGSGRLALVVSAFSLILASYVLIWTRYNFLFPWLQNTWQFLTLLTGPSLYLYLKDVFKEDYSLRNAVCHYSIPVASGLSALPQYLMNFGIQTGWSQDLFTLGSSPVLLVGHLTFYTVLIYRVTQNEWQVDSNIKLWTNILAWGMVTYTLAFLSYFMLVQCSFFSPEWDYSISFVMALGILTVAYMGLLQRRVFSSEPLEDYLPVQKYRSSTLTKSAGESIKRKMELLLNEQQVFKENELRLADLAAYLDVGRHQLSQVINEHYGVNFFELMNRYRLEYVKRLLSDPAFDHYTILQIAYEAGFNNKASFNRFFKKEIGITPSAFRIRENAG